MCLNDELENEIWDLLAGLTDPKNEITLRRIRHLLLQIDLPARAEFLDDKTLLVFHVASRMISDYWKNFAGDAGFSHPVDGRMDKISHEFCNSVGHFSSFVRNCEMEDNIGIRHMSKGVRSYYTLANLLNRQLLSLHREV